MASVFRPVYCGRSVRMVSGSIRTIASPRFFNISTMAMDDSVFPAPGDPAMKRETGSRTEGQISSLAKCSMIAFLFARTQSIACSETDSFVIVAHSTPSSFNTLSNTLMLRFENRSGYSKTGNASAHLCQVLFGVGHVIRIERTDDFDVASAEICVFPASQQRACV